MRSTVFCLIFLLTLVKFLGSHTFAQTTTDLPSSVATKIDEYGLVRGCDHSARLDNFAIQLQNTPGSKAYIFAYGPDAASQEMMEIVKHYLVDSRGLSADLIKIVYAGRNDVLSEPRIQLWLGPARAQLPKPQRFEPNVDTFQGLFAERKAWDPDILENEADESDESKSFPVFEDPGTGPPMRDVSHASLADVLKHQKTAVAHIVAYNGEDAAPGAWRRVAQEQVRRLKEQEIDSSRLNVIYGGSSKETKVQLWVTPATAPPPVADAGPERPPAKTIELGSFSDFDLGYSGVERSAFKRLAESLHQFPTLRACLVVTFGTYQEPLEEPLEEPNETARPEENAAADAPQIEIEPEPEPHPADVTKLVEKWKNELAEKYKIGADRFVVLFTHSDGFASNRVDTYVVPPAGSLPNPYAVEEGDLNATPAFVAQPTPPTPINYAISSKADSDTRVLIGKFF